VRERELDEFSSLFKRSIIPTIEVEKIEVRRILVFGAGRDVADRLAKRFGSTIVEASVEHAEELPALIEVEQPSLIIARGLGALGDALLAATPLPTLILRGDPGDDLFRRILLKIPGGRHDLIEQYSFAFALCAPGGTITLLHVVDQARFRVLAEVLEVTPDVDTHADLLGAAKTRMDHLLRGAIRTAKDAAFDVQSAIEVGDPFEIVPRYAADASLLIVGSQGSHAEFLQSRGFELMRRLPDLPVLAL